MRRARPGHLQLALSAKHPFSRSFLSITSPSSCTMGGASPLLESRLHALLCRRGHEVKVKHVYPLYVGESLTARRRERTRLARERSIQPRLSRANQEWTMRFIVDGPATVRNTSCAG